METRTEERPELTLLFDELRGAVVDLPVGNILPTWVSKAAVIDMIDRIEAEHGGEVVRTMRPDDHRQACLCGHLYADHARGGTHCLGASLDEEQVTGAGMCQCSRWNPLRAATPEADTDGES